MGTNSESWDGRNDNGVLLPSGVYQAKIVAVSFAEESAQGHAIARIDNYMPVIVNVSDAPDPFSPDNDGTGDETTISYTLFSPARLPHHRRCDNVVSVTIVIYGASLEHHQTFCNTLDDLFDDDGEDDFDDEGGAFSCFWNGIGHGPNVVRVVRLDQEPGEQSWTWDGTDSRGEVVANGTYQYTIIARAGWHFSNPKSGMVTVERRDTQPPVAANERPRDGSIVRQRRPIISVDLTDDLSGVDSATIMMMIDNAQVTPTILPIRDGYRVRCQSENWLGPGATVSVKVEASDFEGNSMVCNWSFTVRRGHFR